MDRLGRGVTQRVANAVLAKPNQTGALDAARTVVDHAHAAGYGTVLSARSGETEDDWPADLAVGCRTGQIKVCSTARSERTTKWSRLLRIEAELGARAEYAGAEALATPSSHDTCSAPLLPLTVSAVPEQSAQRDRHPVSPPRTRPRAGGRQGVPR
ncbi:hypothetical protein [Streptomyces sp. NBC_01373]|uniref:hypothetical protein n=1 Tax=unclassified Streptomyces TaxID=2593676 RepID=UPI00338F50D8